MMCDIYLFNTIRISVSEIDTIVLQGLLVLIGTENAYTDAKQVMKLYQKIYTF